MVKGYRQTIEDENLSPEEEFVFEQLLGVAVLAKRGGLTTGNLVKYAREIVKRVKG